MKAQDKYLNKKAEARRHSLFPGVSDQDWDSWQWQVKNRITTLEGLTALMTLTPEEEIGRAHV